MKTVGIDFSIIIPQRNSIRTLSKLFDSIPVSDRIEVILVDNSPVPVTREKIEIEREYTLLWAEPGRYAGGARNKGIENAHGKWLLFADADDFYSVGAFNVFYSKYDSDADIIYFGVSSIFIDTGKYAMRGELYSSLVHEYVSTGCDEYSLRLGFVPPWAKMIKRAYVDQHSFRFDEIISGEDVFFSLLTGFYAHKIDAVDEIVYIVTVNRGSLTMQKNYEMLESGYTVTLRFNQFVKNHGFGKYQKSVARYIVESCRYGFLRLLTFLHYAFLYRQNIFVNAGHWLTTVRKMRTYRMEISRYIVRSQQ